MYFGNCDASADRSSMSDQNMPSLPLMPSLLEGEAWAEMKPPESGWGWSGVIGRRGKAGLAPQSPAGKVGILRGCVCRADEPSTQPRERLVICELCNLS